MLQDGDDGSVLWTSSSLAFTTFQQCFKCICNLAQQRGRCFWLAVLLSWYCTPQLCTTQHRRRSGWTSGGTHGERWR